MVNPYLEQCTVPYINIVRHRTDMSNLNRNATIQSLILTESLQRNL